MNTEADDHPHFSYSSRGSSHSDWGKRKAHRKMTTQWRQLYLSRAKLKAVSRTSALIAGFAMVAMVEVQLDRGVYYNPALLILFSVTTTCLVAVHLFALMIATCMLPNIEAVSNIHNTKIIEQSPHHKMRIYIEGAWVLSTGIGLVLFLIEIALLIWLKFQSIVPPANSSTSNSNATITNPSPNVNAMTPAIVATVLLIPVVILFVAFAVHFYKTLAHHRYAIFEDAVTELDKMNEDVAFHQRTDRHLVVSRQPSGLTIPSHSDRHSFSMVPQDGANSRASTMSGQFSIDPV